MRIVHSSCSWSVAIWKYGSNTIHRSLPGRRDFLAGTAVACASNLLAASLRRRNRCAVSCGGPPPGESLFRCLLQCTDSTWTQTWHVAEAKTAHGYRHRRQQHSVRALIACGFRHGHTWHVATDIRHRHWQLNNFMTISLLNFSN